MVDLRLGDCLTVMPTLDPESVDAIVTDPPYELGFMGKKWDASGISYSVNLWREALRVLKPGAHLVALGGTRTYHRMTVAIEDAGFEIRDCLAWLYGSGFPKSLNLGEGRGTALKPAHEPIVLARKPFTGTVAANVATHGTGALNIEACRLDAGLGGHRDNEPSAKRRYADSGATTFTMLPGPRGGSDQGRWPANVCLDEHAATMLDEQSGTSTSPPIGSMGGGSNKHAIYGDFAGVPNENGYGDTGGASRFFKVAASDCILCGRSVCKTTFASNAARRLELTHQIILATAQCDVPVWLVEQLAQAAPSVENLCERCVTCIALVLAEIKSSGSPQRASRVFLDSMPSSRSSILIQNLASFAELWGNTDTIPTTQSLSILFGSVHHAIEDCIRQESQSAGSDRTRFLYSAKPSRAERDMGCEELQVRQRDESRKAGNLGGDNPRNRGLQPRGNFHPTVKPVELMRWLVRLVTPPAGVVLDPFMGSGTTGMACRYEHRGFIGIERQAEYLAIAEARIASVEPSFDFGD